MKKKKKNLIPRFCKMWTEALALSRAPSTLAGEISKRSFI